MSGRLRDAVAAFLRKNAPPEARGELVNAAEVARREGVGIEDVINERQRRRLMQRQLGSELWRLWRAD